MVFDTSKQVYEADATGWERGLYEDVQATFRAPIVNWIFRTLVANDPDLTRYLWGQLKPLFETRAFGEATVAYRDAVLDELEADLPRYGPAELALSPGEWRELQGQLRTFDTVVPRLALTFEVVYRSLHERGVGTDPASGYGAAAPIPEWVDGDRGLPPTMAAFDDPDEPVAETVASIQAFHGFDEGLPSIYRCLVQWPEATTRLWDDLGPLLSSPAFDRACEHGRAVTESYVESVAYRPALSPAELERRFDSETLESVVGLFDDFARGPVETVLPAVVAIAATAGVSGPSARATHSRNGA